MRAPHARSLCLILGLLPGCFMTREVVNEPLDVRTVRSIVPGETTAREVLDRLGAPTEVIQLGRRSAYRFDSSVSKRAGIAMIVLNLLGEDTRSDRLWVFLNEQDVVTHYGATFASHRSQYAMPWEDIHEASDSASKDEDRDGLGGEE